MMYKVPNRKIVSRNFSRALFSLLDFLFLEDGIHTLSQNFGMELPLYGVYQGADKSLAWPGRKQARKHVRDARDFNNIEKRDVIKFSFLQDKVPKEIQAILTEILACFLPGWAKDLSAPL